jgi:DNA repair protein RadD
VIEARWYQTASIDSAFDYWRDKPEGDPVIALPTGTGKGVVIALLCQRIMQAYPMTRILMLTHVKELIEQNAKKMREVWPLAPLGIHSAGLGHRDAIQPLIFGGIGSVRNRLDMIGLRHLLIIDEAHLLSPDDETMYRKVIKELRTMYPQMRILGLTATPYRTGQGMITEGGMFSDICFDMTDVSGFNRLIAEGYLAPLHSKPTQTEINVSGIHIEKGEFNQAELNAVVDQKPLTRKILEEWVYYGQDRHSWLYFASGIENAEHVAEMLRKDFNVSAFAVHSKTEKGLRKRAIDAYKNGEYQCIVSNNVLTTGFDDPKIDYIGMGRATMSPGLWVQMGGRGTRPFSCAEWVKRDCMLMDFAGNRKRLGPINDPYKPRKKGEGGGDAPVRICPNPSCGVYNHAAARECYACGHIFTFREKLVSSATTEEMLKDNAPIFEWFDINRVHYSIGISKKREDAKPYLKVGYVCGLRMFHEFVFLDAGGSAGHNAREWWRKRHEYEPPTPKTCHPFESATHAAMSVQSQLRVPRRVKVQLNTQYPIVHSVEY